MNRHAFTSWAPAVVLAAAGLALIRLGRWLAQSEVHADLGD